MNAKNRSVNPINNPSHIVCVGASAGGLEALIAFFKSIPKTTNMAFVLIQHLEPKHKSALSEILSRETSLNVREAKNNIPIERAHVYVIPPNTRMAISGRKLRITSRITREDGRYLPIDFFMTSLAKAEGGKAVGVILSGTGSDGTQGAKAIKGQGGLVFAQDEKTARYFGMPESAIASGAVDFVLEPKKIAQKLARLKVHGGSGSLKGAGKSVDAGSGLNRILVLLKDRTGVDFVHYKHATIIRRIARQMALRNSKSYDDYYRYLKKNPGEADVVRKDLIISVTSFFRDPKLYVPLREKVFPLLLNKRSYQNPIRLWVPACSSGEEVYSLAIILSEFLESKKMKPYIQVFGTDLGEIQIEKARAGVYPNDISTQISAERLRRFFTKTETGYKIAKNIRDLCIFAKHDITRDPPLSHMDIVSCRNLLIYLDTFLQNKTLAMLHYALKPKGFLVLGTAESVTSVPNHFSPMDKKHKIYLKNVFSRRISTITETPTGAFKTSKVKPRVEEKKIPKVVLSKVQFSEDKRTLNEELKAANEEIQSSNEELQSMNEELETSKEELQSTNEELMTLNEELQNKNSELTNLNSDLSNVFSSTNIPIIIVGNDLRIKRFTPTARKVMNLIPTDVDRPIGDIKLNVDINNLEETILEVIEDMALKESEVQDKEGRWYSVRIRPYRTIDNKIDGAIIALIDIDVSKRTQEEVQKVLSYNQAIIETMREPLLVLDKDANIQLVNKSFCDMFRLRASDLKNKLLYEILQHKWDHPSLRNLLEKVLPKNNYFNDFELSYDSPDTGPKTLVLNGRQIKSHGKSSPLILLVIEDITKRRKADEIVERDHQALDKMVNKRSKALLRLRLELVKSKHLSDIGTMAATVAHELRNPLAQIAISTHRIKKIVKDHRIEEMLAGISARVVESNQIISNILMYSKTTITHFERVKINDILKHTLEEERQRLPRSKISLIEKLGPTKDVFIEVDPIRIKEVFRNILHNASDAMHGDTSTIEIESKVDSSTVSVFIKDNGEGIAKKDLKNVTSPFFTTKAKGTGLGLALCKQVLMLHKGSITIKSVKNQGTTVEVTLPLLARKDEE